MLSARAAGHELRAVVLAAAELRGIHTETQLAEELRLSKDALQRWWRDGSVPRPDNLERLAEVLGIPEPELLRVARGQAGADDYELRPRLPAEAELESVLRQAYERGFAAGFRAARQGPDTG